VPFTVGELNNVKAEGESLAAPVKLIVATPLVTLRLVITIVLGGVVPDLVTW
jgi:hypothetical protein